MRNIFHRKTKLLSQRDLGKNLIGYARALDGEEDYLKEQILSLKNFGCNKVYSEIISLNAEEKPQMQRAFDSLSTGDELVLTKLDRIFKSKSDCIKTINNLLNQGIKLTNLKGFVCSDHGQDVVLSIFNILYELDHLENDYLKEKKIEMLKKRRIVGGNLGGRPKIDRLKESLVIKLRKEGFSYRSIKLQTGIALSTIRRVIVDAEN